ncbi:MAG: PIN domain-containing protein [Pseudomonadota bacterium]
MRLVLDACVLFPTVMREMLVGAAQAGVFVPLWSPRILEEWVRATHRLGEGAPVIAKGEAVLMDAQFPQASITPSQDLAMTLSLPDPNDTHVLAAALEGRADGIVTKNARDFPTRTLSRYGLILRDPDTLLLEAHHEGFAIRAIADQMAARAKAAGGEGALRPLLKRTGLPRLAKVLSVTP